MMREMTRKSTFKQRPIFEATLIHCVHVIARVRYGSIDTNQRLMIVLLSAFEQTTVFDPIVYTLLQNLSQSIQ